MRQWVCAAAVAVIGFAAADGATVTWNGGDGLFKTDTNWTPTGVPGISSDVIIGSGTAEYIPGGDLAVHSLTLNGGSFFQSGGNGWMQFGGRSLTVNSGTFDAGTSDQIILNSTSAISVTGGTLKMLRLNLGYNPSTLGSLSFTGGTILAKEFHPYTTFTLNAGTTLSVDLISFDSGNGNLDFAGGNLTLNAAGSKTGFYPAGGTSRYLNFLPGCTGTLKLTGTTLAEIGSDRTFTTFGMVRYDGVADVSKFTMVQSGADVLVSVPEPTALATGLIGSTLMLARRRRTR